MATLTNEQIEQKKQQLKNELVEAGAIELSEDDLDKAAGGLGGQMWTPSSDKNRPQGSTGQGAGTPGTISPPDM